MRLAFIDFTYGYDAARPDSDAPLGGTTTAICFLAREMVRQGIGCTFFNPVPEAREAHGIPALPLQALAQEVGDTYDAYIFCGRWTAGLVGLVRAHTKAPLIGWMHESAFTAPMTPALPDFDGMVYVSDWQKRVNEATARPHWQQAVIRNAMNPGMANSFAAGTAILAAKTKPPIFLFAGSFARGAAHVPPILDKIRQRRSDFSAEIFCNLDPSRHVERDALYINWLRAQPNIAHVGMVAQKELAERMRRGALFLAPNPWPETSCITLIEALASGMSAITTTRAALPETSSGFAKHISIDNEDDQTRFDMTIDYDAFADAALETLRAIEEKSAETERKLRRQVDYFINSYQWSQRVATWIGFIEKLA